MSNEKLRQFINDLGACPDCLEVQDHAIDEPISSCQCGATEDYGTRPLQRLQFLENDKKKGND